MLVPLDQEAPESIEYSQDLASGASVTETVPLLVGEEGKVTEGGSGAVESMVSSEGLLVEVEVLPRESELRTWI